MEVNVSVLLVNNNKYQMREKNLKRKLIIILYPKMLFNNVQTKLEEEIIEKHKHTLKCGIEK